MAMITYMVKGGDDFIVGLGGNDWLIGDGIVGGYGDDTITGGNDAINAVDSTTNNDNINGDNIDDSTTSITLGNQDICASDPDPEVNCEYYDISSNIISSV